ncbi:lithostathine-like [Delphinapterus leucas]|uniref:Lithostathine-like n=1 Tax=Delphinapterus leucas TaxID=9749 RepID=A0A2Y9MR13_DELLE|nr:lithostathine-like [Delphinapterus leucas]
MMPSMGVPSLSWMLPSCLLLLSQVQREDSQKELPSAWISCPKGSMAYASYCYALISISSSVSPFFTKMACQKRPSGHLVSVLSGAEGSFISSLLKNNLKLLSDVWIGLHDPTEGSEPSAGGWEWSSTDVLNYVAWERSPATTSNPGYC